MPQQPIKKIKIETPDGTPFIIDVGALAENIIYNNTATGLDSTDVQAALDELIGILDYTLMDFQGATASTPGEQGFVPAPYAGDQDKFLQGNGYWGSAIHTTEKGSVNGVAELDETGKVPISQLPATMSQLEKYPTRADFPATGGDNILYVALDTNFTYRWTGVDYVQIDESIQLGETSSTAYRGDRGKTAYDHSQITNGNPHRVTASDVGLGVPRVAKSCNSLPGTNTVAFEEYTAGTNYDLPSNHFYHIITMEGSDSNYATQLAFGMTTTNCYHRNRNAGTWGSWISFKSQADIDAAVAAAMVGNATAADVLSGKTFTNSTTSGLTGTIGNASVTGGTNSNDGYTASIAAKKYTGASGSSVTVAKGAVSGATNSNDGYTASIPGARYTGASGSSVTISKASVSGAAQSNGSFKYSITGGKYTGANGSSGTISKLTPSYSSGSSQSSLLAGGTATLPANTYNKDSYTITAASLSSQTSATAGAGQIVKDYTAWVNGSKVTGTFTPQTLSKDPSTSSQTYYPDSGKYLSSFTVNAISPQRSASGEAATSSGTYMPGSNKGYVTFPYGWYPSDKGMCILTQAQAQAAHSHTEIATPTGSDLRNTKYDLGELHSYRYVNTNVCYLQGSFDERNGHNGYIATEAYISGECYARLDLYSIASGTTITFVGMPTDRNKKIFIENASGVTLYDSGYTTAGTLSYTTTSETALCIKLWSQTGLIVWANFGLSR